MPPLELVQAVSVNTFSVCFHFKFKQQLKRSSGDSQGKECLALKIHGGSDRSSLTLIAYHFKMLWNSV